MIEGGLGSHRISWERRMTGWSGSDAARAGGAEESLATLT